jgi:hypothetical protein
LLNKTLIKQIVIIALCISYSQLQSIWVTPPTTTSIIQHNLKNDPWFRLCLGKAAIANLANAHTAYKQNKKCTTASNVALCALALYTLGYYPANGVWPVYTHLMSPEQLTTLKIATTVSIVNTCANSIANAVADDLFPRKHSNLTPKPIKDPANPANWETFFSVVCCVLPLYSMFEFRIEPSFSAVKVGVSFIR